MREREKERKVRREVKERERGKRLGFRSCNSFVRKNNVSGHTFHQGKKRGRRGEGRKKEEKKRVNPRKGG